ncbi:MAG TPA: hypothetical protein VIX80_09115 [Candidatus Kapabacteria bacterium]
MTYIIDARIIKSVHLLPVFEEMKKLVSIALLVLLGLQFNAATLLWVGYSTFAHDYFVSNCENPTSVTCNGHCQVEKAEKKAAQTQKQSMPSLNFAKIHPVIVTGHSNQVLVFEKTIKFVDQTPSLLRGVKPKLILPPRA